MWYVLLFCQLPPGSARGGVENLAKLEQDKTTYLVLWIGIVLIPVRIRLSILIPIHIRIRSLPNFNMCWKNRIFCYFYSQQCQLNLFCLCEPRQRYRRHNFQYFRQYCRCSEEKD
jgi:hypothetical protein